MVADVWQFLVDHQAIAWWIVGLAIAALVGWYVVQRAKKAFSDKVLKHFGFRPGSLPLADQLRLIRDRLDPKREEVRAAEDLVAAARTKVKEAEAELHRLQAGLEARKSEFKEECELARVLRTSGI